MTEHDPLTGARPRPTVSGFDNWSEPAYAEGAVELERDPLSDTDPSGRHAVPEQQPPDPATTTSYGRFLDDPPYARADEQAAPSDAGTPPRPSPLSRTGLRDDDPVLGYGDPAGSGAGHPLGTHVEPYGSGGDTYAGSVAPYRGSAAQPQVTAPTLDNELRDSVTCPECGQVQQVHLQRREATDFCTRCDYPLFWTPSQVIRERALGEHSEALRRLPGTVGRSTLASVPCPFCAELNLPSAQVCVRCQRSMHPVAAPPPVVYVPPPPPAPMPEPEPETGIPWWVWALVALGSAVVIALVVWYAVAHH